MNRIDSFCSKISGVLPSIDIQTQPQKVEIYKKDESSVSKFLPLGVVFPKTTQEVSLVLKTANEMKIPVVPRGAGTGLAGGALPVENCLVLSLEKMNQILSINTKDMIAVVQPGVVTAVVRDAAQALGLFYPPTPASVDSCSIGGNIATNAGGLSAVKYGVTRQFVLGVEAVLAFGEILRTGGPFVKKSTGYDLTSLLVGSEGTLAVITEITLRLLPAPKESISLLVPFDSVSMLVETVNEILEKQILPPTLELIPRTAVQCVLQQDPKLTFPFPEHEATLLVELDGFSSSALEEELGTLAEIFEKRSAGEPQVAATKSQREEMWKVRKMIREAIVRLGKFVEADSVVPRSRLSDLIASAEGLAKKYGIQSFAYGHAGDGNLHTYFLQSSLAESQWPKTSEKILSEFFDETLRLGGTISGEHGIGLLKREFLPKALGPLQLQLMKQLKAAFDPNNILNPGKLFCSKTDEGALR